MVTINNLAITLMYLLFYKCLDKILQKSIFEISARKHFNKNFVKKIKYLLFFNKNILIFVF